MSVRCCFVARASENGLHKQVVCVCVCVCNNFIVKPIGIKNTSNIKNSDSMEENVRYHP